MKSQNTKIIILGHKNFGESDKLVFIYSEEFGKLKIIAKGARRITSKFTGHLETLNFADAQVYFGPRNIILIEISTTSTCKHLLQDLEKLKGALQIAEITEQSIYENQKIPGLVELLKDSIRHLSTSSRPSTIAYSYIIKFLDLLGMIPDFKSLPSRLPKKYLKFLHFIKENSYFEIEKIVTNKEEQIEIREILKRIIEYQTEHPLKSLAI